jgi:hypothetical protein
MAIQRLEAQLGAEAGFVNKLRDDEQEHVSTTAHAFRNLEAQQLTLASGLAALGDKLAAETNTRTAQVRASIDSITRCFHPSHVLSTNCVCPNERRTCSTGGGVGGVES